MRLDKWLKVSRLIKRRTPAKSGILRGPRIPSRSPEVNSGRSQGALTGALARRFPPAASQGGRGAPILLPKDCGFMRLDKWLKFPA